MDLLETFSNNWIALVIVIIILVIIISFNEIRVSNSKWTYKSRKDIQFHESFHEPFYSDYFHLFYSAFNSEVYQIITNIHKKFLDCLEAEYFYVNIRHGKKWRQDERGKYISSQISDPELRLFAEDPLHWLEQHLPPNKDDFYEENTNPDVVNIKIAELVPVFHGLIERIFVYLKEPLDKDWISFYALIAKRKAQYKNKQRKTVLYLLVFDVLAIIVFYASISLLTNQVASIFIIFLPMFFLGFFQPFLWKFIQNRFFETQNTNFFITKDEGI